MNLFQILNKKFKLIDTSIPTINTGVPNTESGHCSKTLQILKLAYEEVQYLKENSNNIIQWIFLADDDTLLR